MMNVHDSLLNSSRIWLWEKKKKKHLYSEDGEFRELCPIQSTNRIPWYGNGVGMICTHIFLFEHEEVVQFMELCEIQVVFLGSNFLWTQHFIQIKNWEFGSGWSMFWLLEFSASLLRNHNNLIPISLSSLQFFDRQILMDMWINGYINGYNGYVNGMY